MICWTEETYVDFHSFESWYRYVAGMDNLKDTRPEDPNDTMYGPALEMPAQMMEQQFEAAYKQGMQQEVPMWCCVAGCIGCACCFQACEACLEALLGGA